MNYRLNLQSPIIPKKSAAGFELGLSFDDVVSSLTNYTCDYKIEIDKSTQRINIINKDSKSTIVSFNFINCFLYQILLREGYQGLLYNDVKIGDKLSKLNMYIPPLEYDDGDELYYIDLDEDLGIGFYLVNEQYLTEETYDYDGPELIIITNDILEDAEIELISVHNYELLKN